MNFFEGIGMFIVAALVFLILSFLIGAIFTSDHTEWIYVYAGAWISGSVVYGITVVLLIYISRYGGSL